METWQDVILGMAQQQERMADLMLKLTERVLMLEHKLDIENITMDDQSDN